MRSVENVKYFDNGWFISINGKMGRDEERMKAVIRSRDFFLPFFPPICSRDVTLKLRITISREKPEWKIDGRAVTRNFNKKFLAFRCVTPPHCGHKLSLLNTFLPSFNHRLCRRIDRLFLLFSFQSWVIFLSERISLITFFNRRDSN